MISLGAIIIIIIMFVGTKGIVGVFEEGYDDTCYEEYYKGKITSITTEEGETLYGKYYMDTLERGLYIQLYDERGILDQYKIVSVGKKPCEMLWRDYNTIFKGWENNENRY